MRSGIGLNQGPVVTVVRIGAILLLLSAGRNLPEEGPQKSRLHAALRGPSFVGQSLQNGALGLQN
jgi:hypothetical protein